MSTNLRIPGPTPCPDDVLAAVGGQMINHRGPEFAAISRRVADGLRWAFRTQNEVMIATTSGTGGLEFAVVNTLSPGDRVLAVSIGSFGDRFASIAEAYGADVIRHRVESGQAAEPAEVERLLREHPDVAAVLVTHNETSTGVTNPLHEIARVVRAHGALLLVDAVSSLGSIPVAVDDWGLDVVVSGSQKGWMVPPGLAFVSFSGRAWKANEIARMPRFYFDARKHLESQQKGQTPWTPAVSIYFGLDVALEKMQAEGLEAVYTRHQQVGEYTRAMLRGLGLELFADPRYASNTVTTVKAPPAVDVSLMLRKLREEQGVVLAGGQGPLQGKIFRVGHLGLVDTADIDGVKRALQVVLAELAPATRHTGA